MLNYISNFKNTVRLSFGKRSRIKKNNTKQKRNERRGKKRRDKFVREKIHSLLSFYHIRFEKRSSPSNKWIISQFGQLRDRQKKKNSEIEARARTRNVQYARSILARLNCSLISPIVTLTF